MLPMPRERGDFDLVMATRDGMIKKTNLDEFRNLRKSGLISIILRDQDELIGVRLATEQDEIILGSRSGMAIRFATARLRAMGRSSMGVHAMRLDEGDEIIDIDVIESGMQLLAITSQGYGKRMDPDEFREQGRNGKGLRAINLTEKTGELAALLLVRPEEDLLLITDAGVIIRIAVDTISLYSRYAKGVRVMKLAEDTRIISVARSEKEEADSTEE